MPNRMFAIERTANHLITTNAVSSRPSFLNPTKVAATMTFEGDNENFLSGSIQQAFVRLVRLFRRVPGMVHVVLR